MATYNMTKKRANKILKVLRKEFELPNWRERQKDPFKTLVRTVISQNTASRNTTRAFEKLSKTFEIVPEALSKADVAEIEEALKVAGLYRNKARAIKKLSSIILEDFSGSLDFIFKLPLEQAREKLLKLPGVGPKTADVVLLFSARKPTLPVDTHVNRVSKRLKLVSMEADYEDVRKGLQMLFHHQDYYTVHVLLILHGRKYCKAKNPLCKQCPINEWCPSKQMED
jgi:endonuclease-3